MRPVMLPLVLLLATCVSGLFEDQVNKWDWRLQLIGPVTHVLPRHLSSSASPPDLIIGTSASVIASLSLSDGSIRFRHILEEDRPLNALSPHDRYYGLKEGISSSGMTSISSDGALVRSWDGKGALLWEKSLPAEVYLSDKRLIFSIDADKNEVSVVEVDEKTGKVVVRIFSADSSLTLKNSGAFDLSTTAGKIGDVLIASSTPVSVLIVNHANINILSLDSDSKTSIKSIPISSLGLPDVKPSSIRQSLLCRERTESLVSLTLTSDTGSNKQKVDNVVLRLSSGEVTVAKFLPDTIAVSVVFVSGQERKAAFLLSSVQSSSSSSPVSKYEIRVLDSETWQELPSLKRQVSVNSGAEVSLFQILPQLTSATDGLIDSYHVLLSLSDASLTLFSPESKGKSDKQLSPVWVREESLSLVLETEFVDLPLEGLDDWMEEALLSPNPNIVASFLTRIKSQVQQLQSWIKTTAHQVRQLVLKDQSSPSSSSLLSKSRTGVNGKSLTRDYFGLRKLIVMVTECGTIVSMDTQTGHIVWKLFDRQLGSEIRESGNTAKLIVSRTSSFFPHPASAFVVTATGLILSFDPITGTVTGRQKLDQRIKQLMQLPFSDESHAKGVLLLTTADTVVLHPQSLWQQFVAQRNAFFMMTADAGSGKLRGLSFRSVGREDEKATVVWSSNIPIDSIPSTTTAGKTLKVTFKRWNEQVHSLGRVLGDRNVLYKYLNPNLAVISTIRTESSTSTDGNTTTTSTSGLVDVYLIDAVTGRIIHSSSHRKARGPVFVIHSENSVIYSFYNEKSRRTEISAIDLYEGLNQVNGSAFSSLDWGSGDASQQQQLQQQHQGLVIEHNSFIFPTGIRVMTDTTTEKGLTNKHLLIAMPSGGLLELPKVFLDPRRPLVPTAEHREEGLIPYLPELPIPSEGFLNYNKSLMRIRRISTSGSGLESTCLLLAQGLDLFHTRVTPSKTFDILKDDFDHVLISAVLVVLIALAYASKWASAHKSLKAAWT